MKAEYPSVLRGWWRVTLVFWLFFGVGWGVAAPNEKGRGQGARSVEIQGTQYLDDPALLRNVPMLLPTPTPTPSPTPKASPSLRERETESRREVRSGVASVVGVPTGRRGVESDFFAERPRGNLTVGRVIPVPESYSAARVVAGGGQVVVIPSSPTRFRQVETGVTFGESGFRSVELEGFINYGSPIRTVVPVYGRDGRVLGGQVILTPNPVLQPVYRRTEFR